MVELDSRQFQGLKKHISTYRLGSTLPQLVGLLTVPSLHANTVRLEVAVHLAVACCRGDHPMGRADMERLLNAELEGVRRLEDPVEDVFVANVMTPQGNRRVFQGVWKANDYYAQNIVDILLSYELPDECSNLFKPISALLRLGEEIAKRMNLRRWHHESSTPQCEIRIPPKADLQEAARAVTFSERRLLELGVDPNFLDPFVLRESDRQSIVTQTIGNTSLERRPLVRIGKKLICALPQSISPAIRRFVVGELRRIGHLTPFARALADLQSDQVKTEVCSEFREFTPHRDFPEPGGRLPALHSLLMNYDIDKFLHVLFIHGDLNLIETHGFSGSKRYPPAIVSGLEQYIEKVANWCKSQQDSRDGTTLLIIGGMGEPSMLGLSKMVEDWQFSSIVVPDFDMLTSESQRPLTRYLKFLKQRSLIEKTGFRFYCVEDYDLYCHWRQTDYLPVLRQLPLRHGSICPVLGGSAWEVRTETRALVDWHVVLDAQGHHIPVKRLRSDPLFASQRDKPIYGIPSSVVAGILAGAIETTHGVSWFTVSTRQEQSLLDLPYRIWDGFIDLFERLVAGIEKIGLRRRSNPIEVRIDCSSIESLDEALPSEPLPTPSEPKVAIDASSGIATIRLPLDFLHFFRQPDNSGERLLARSIARCLVGLHVESKDQSETEILDSLTGWLSKDRGLRVIHAIQTGDPIEIVRQNKRPRELKLLSQMDYRFLNVGLCEGIAPRIENSFLESKERCNTLLHKLVVSLNGRVRTSLRGLDRASVIREMLETVEAVIADRIHWARTARAMIALYSGSRSVFSTANEREGKRASTALAARSIMEMAICECPSDGGRQVSSWESDELLAIALFMINTAADSDAIHHDLTEPRIELFANGEYNMDRRFREHVMAPFLATYNRNQFEEDAEDYENLYSIERPASDEREGHAIPEELVIAFEAEFGLTPEHARLGIEELIQLAVLQEKLVVETTVGQIRLLLMQSCGYTTKDCNAFLQSFGLAHRPNWEVPPDGSSKRDIYPWRYGRRQSAVVRPVLLLGERESDTALYSVSMLKDGFMHLVGKILEGHLSQDFFTSTQMRSYIGKVNHSLGLEFEKKVAGKLNNCQWTVRRRLSMSELDAPPELGDVDVLAWKADGQVLVVECKRLQFARTVAEIAEVCRRFRGEARDELGKHLQRLKWIQKNPASLKRVLGFVPDVKQIRDWIVTSNEVPLSYLTSLPIETEKIVPLPKFRP